jgi:uncharacterized membrane protein
MGSTTHSIEVNAPLRTVYNQWTQFEEFPLFMQGVEEVRQEGDKGLFWRANVGGKIKEWQAAITRQVPDERIAWKSIDGSANSGTVVFRALDSSRTKVTATIEYEPEGLLEKTGDALGIPSGRVQADLERFRDFIEARARESGGWRGQIDESSSRRAIPATGSREGFSEEIQGQPYQTEQDVEVDESGKTSRKTETK